MSLASPASPASLDFDQTEYRERLFRVQEELCQLGADVLVVDQLDHVAYLTGYLPTAARYQAAVVPAEGDPALLVRELDLPTFRSQSWVTAYTAFPDHHDSMDALRRMLLELKPRRLALEMDSNMLTVQRMRQLTDWFPDVTPVDFSGVIWEQRLKKSPAEVALLRSAAKIADATLMSGVDAVGTGRSERAPAVAAYTTALELGADNGRVATFGYGTTVENMHGRLGQRMLESGELYYIEAVPQVRGYSARVARPIAIGPPTRRQANVAERLIAAQDAQIAAMTPGAKAEDVDRICREPLLREGIKSSFPQLTGYTLGYHAVPRTSDHTRIFAPEQTWQIKPGMVFHMIVFADGLPFSETVHVTERGPERLTRTPRELFVR